MCLITWRTSALPTRLKGKMTSQLQEEEKEEKDEEEEEEELEVEVEEDTAA